MEAKRSRKIFGISGFTLVELIVVIGILTILGTLAFVQLGGFSSSARDGSRVSDMANIIQALELTKIKTGYYPTPSSSTGVTFSGGVVWYQGTIGDSVISVVGAAGTKFSKKPMDPKYTNTEYSYSVLENNKEYQIGAVMEDSSTAISPIITPVYAANENPSAYLRGNYNGLIAKSKDPSSGATYFLALPSIMLEDATITDLKSVSTQSGNLVLHKKGNLPGSYTPVVQTPANQSYFYSPLGIAANAVGTGILVYVAPDIGKMVASDITSLTTNLKSIYQASGLGSDSTSASQVSSVVNSTTASTMMANVVNGSLGVVKVEISSILKPQDVFSTLTYTGNGSSQTITNGIDLAGNGGMVWIKGRWAYGNSNNFYDTVRGAGKYLWSNATVAEWTLAALTAFNTSGFSLGGSSQVNYGVGPDTYASWTYRKAPKFFDVVSYNWNWLGSNSISHSLGIPPGMIIIKQTNAANNWIVKHQSFPNTDAILLNFPNAKFTDSTIAGGITDTSTNFYVWVHNTVNASGATYIAYLFAHNPDTTNGLIQEGSFTTDASWNATVSTIGWEPQYIMFKTLNTTGNWIILDQTRWWGTGTDKALFANTSGIETTTDYGAPTSNGFTFTDNNANQAYIYMVIRKAY